MNLRRQGHGRSRFRSAFLSRNRPRALLGQAVLFQFAAPEGLDYAVNRYRREAERHYRVLDSQLAGRDYIVGSDYTMVDMSAWGWIDRASRVMKGADVSPDSSKNRATLAGLGVGWKWERIIALTFRISD